MKFTIMRSQLWLNRRLEQIWTLLFPEIPKANTVIAKFQGKWKNKFGHIHLKRDKSTEIVINSLFQHEQVPEFMVDLTLAHELIHYTHGFQSPLPQQYKHPHKGGIVTKELKKRGFGHLLREERLFLKKEWLPLYDQLRMPFVRRRFP